MARRGLESAVRYKPKGAKARRKVYTKPEDLQRLSSTTLYTMKTQSPYTAESIQANKELQRRAKIIAKGEPLTPLQKVRWR